MQDYAEPVYAASTMRTVDGYVEPDAHLSQLVVTFEDVRTLYSENKTLRARIAELEAQVAKQGATP